MDLLWRNDIDPAKVVMGLGFYGRSKLIVALYEKSLSLTDRLRNTPGFTLNDTSCVTSGCPFSTTGNPGPCTNSAGTLSFTEIEDILDDESRGAVKTYDAEAAVQIVVSDGDQWVSYDDWESFETKMDYANSHCLGGTMVWAVSLDSSGTATSRSSLIVYLLILRVRDQTLS